MIFRTILAASLVVAAMIAPARADEYGGVRIYSTEADFAFVKEDVEGAILAHGFKVDYHGFIGNMLKRTGQDLGATKVIYKDAEFFQFCSATLSRATMEGDPRNIGFCPYVVTVYELTSEPGTVYVSYRRPLMVGSEESKAALAAVDKTLDEIARAATQ